MADVIIDYENMPYHEYMEKCMEDMKREANQYFDELVEAKEKIRKLEESVAYLEKQLSDMTLEREAIQSKLATMQRSMELSRPCD